VTLYESGFDQYGTPAHSWLEYEGRCYDAECPDGVASPPDLPFYRREGCEVVRKREVV
jgi:hypothetical protein